MNSNIASIRKDYQMKALDERTVSNNPTEQFGRWWQDAVSSQIEEVNAMTLATCNAAGRPSARIVLLKDFDDNGFVFYTNYHSRKAKDLKETQLAALVFFWKELERQIRIEGSVMEVSAIESDEYFKNRPRGSRLGAWASPQSKVITGRNVLEENVTELEKNFGDAEIDRPAHWGGYRLKPDLIEFWQGRSNRLHDRLQYTIKDPGNWQVERLAP